MAAPRRIDYARLEPAWRAGIKSPNQMAEEYKKATGDSVSHTAINKHFKALGIPRDLNARIQAKADAIVSASIVSGKVSSETNETDAKIIADNAVIIAEVRLAQRTDIQKARKLVMQLLTELEQQTDHADLLEQLAELLLDDNDEEKKSQSQLKRWEAFNRAMSLGGRTGTMKSLADSLKTLVGLEREAFGIDKTDSPPSLGEFLESLN